MKLTPTTIEESRDLLRGDRHYRVHVDVEGVHGVSSALVQIGRNWAPNAAHFFDGKDLLPPDHPRAVEHAPAALAAALAVVAEHYPEAVA